MHPVKGTGSRPVSVLFCGRRHQQIASLFNLILRLFICNIQHPVRHHEKLEIIQSSCQMNPLRIRRLKLSRHIVLKGYRRIKSKNFHITKSHLFQPFFLIVLYIYSPHISIIAPFSQNVKDFRTKKPITPRFLSRIHHFTPPGQKVRFCHKFKCNPIYKILPFKVQFLQKQIETQEKEILILCVNH